MIKYNISGGIREALFKLMKKCVESKIGNKSLTVNEIYPDLSTISGEAENEAQKYLEQGKPEIACTIFILVSEVFMLNKSFVSEKNTAEMLVSAAVSWSARADSMINVGKDSYWEQSSNFSRAGNYGEASDYKTKATILDPKVIRSEVEGILYKIVDELLISLNLDPEYLLDLLDKQELQSDNAQEIIKKDNSVDENLIVSRGSFSERISLKDLRGISLKDIIEAIANKRKGTESSEFVTADDIEIENDYKASPRTGNYDWRVYLNVDNKIAEQIDSVTYTLHPTFMNPEITIRNDPAGKYVLNRSGWGEFEIKTDIRLRKGDVITKYHWLNLGSKSS